jgi:hypothetical protein
MERRDGENMEEYILRYDKISNECSREKECSLVSEIKGCHLIERANLTEAQKQMVLSACSSEKLIYDKVAQVMKRIFSSLGGEKEEEWWESKSKPKEKEETQRNFTYVRGGASGRGRGRNPMGRYGRISKCAICGSEFHWARECPRNAQNKREGSTTRKREEEKRKEGDEKVYMSGMMEDEVNYWEEVEAILDTGCNSTVIGEL